MARGWESKAIEAQQEEAAERTSSLKPRLTVEQALQQRDKDSLRLARQRVLRQLESSHDPRHRKMLESALATLEERLAG